MSAAAASLTLLAVVFVPLAIANREKFRAWLDDFAREVSEPWSVGQ